MEAIWKNCGIAILIALFTMAGMSIAEAGGKKAAVTGMVNINTATREELMLLPGIGKAKADAVLAYRQQQSFSTPQDLLKVSGIGQSIFNQVQSHVTVDGVTTLKAEAAPAKPASLLPSTAGEQS